MCRLLNDVNLKEDTMVYKVKIWVDHSDIIPYLNGQEDESFTCQYYSYGINLYYDEKTLNTIENEIDNNIEKKIKNNIPFNEDTEIEKTYNKYLYKNRKKWLKNETKIISVFDQLPDDMFEKLLEKYNNFNWDKYTLKTKYL